MSFSAWHLPVPVEETRELIAGPGHGLRCAYPEPTADLMAETARRLRAAGDRLHDRPVREIVEAVDRVAARFLDHADSLRQEAAALLVQATGFSEPMTALLLDRMAADWRAGPLTRLLEAELGTADALDRFVDRAHGGRARAYGIGPAFHLFAGNVPGVAVTSMIRSLIVKAPVLAKTASSEPVLPVLFARAIAAEDAALGDALAVTYFPGADADDAPLAAALAEARLAVVYGGREAVDAVRRAAPTGLEIRSHGPRFSAGIVADAQALEPADIDRIAGEIARAVATFDQHGCVSPHAVWVEDPGHERALELARRTAQALAGLETEMPRGALTDAEASAFRQARGAAEMRGHGGAPIRVFGADHDPWAVVYDADTAFRPSCLNRFVSFHPVPDLAAAVDALADHSTQLQSVALECDPPRRQDVAHQLARVGATRITTFATLPWPPPHWHHDGAGPLLELVRWVDLET